MLGIPSETKSKMSRQRMISTVSTNQNKYFKKYRSIHIM